MGKELEKFCRAAIAAKNEATLARIVAEDAKNDDAVYSTKEAFATEWNRHVETLQNLVAIMDKAYDEAGCLRVWKKKGDEAAMAALLADYIINTRFGVMELKGCNMEAPELFFNYIRMEANAVRKLEAYTTALADVLTTSTVIERTL